MRQRCFALRARACFLGKLAVLWPDAQYMLPSCWLTSNQWCGVSQCGSVALRCTCVRVCFLENLAILWSDAQCMLVQLLADVQSVVAPLLFQLASSSIRLQHPSSALL